MMFARSSILSAALVFFPSAGIVAEIQVFMAPVETETRRSSTHKNPLGDELTLPDLLYLPVFADHGRHDRQAGDDVGRGPQTGLDDSGEAAQILLPGLAGASFAGRGWRALRTEASSLTASASSLRPFRLPTLLLSVRISPSAASTRLVPS